MGAVLLNRSTHVADVLLILVRQNAVHHGIRRVPGLVAKVAARATGKRVRPGLGDHVDLEAERAALCRIEAARLQLHLTDRVAAEARWSGAGRHRQELRDLLAVEVDLVVAVPLRAAGRVRRRGGVRVDRVAPRSRRDEDQFHPVAPIERQRLGLRGIDVAAHTRVRSVDQRRLGRDGERLLDARHRQLKIDDGVLANEQCDAAGQRREPRQRGGHPVRANPHRNPIRAADVGDRVEAVARLAVDGMNRHAGHERARLVADLAAQSGFLGTRGHGPHHHHDREGGRGTPNDSGHRSS